MRQSEVLSLMRENVAYKLQHGRAKEAVDMLEKLHKYVKYSVSPGTMFVDCVEYPHISSVLLFSVFNPFNLILKACTIYLLLFQGRSTRCENISSAYQSVFPLES